MNDDMRQFTGHLVMLTKHVEVFLADLKKQAQESQTALRVAREEQVSQFRQDITEVFDEQQQRFETALRPKLVRAWQFVAVMGLLILVLVGGGMGLSSHYLGVIEANRQSAEMIKAINRADVTICGERLCARIDRKATPWGEKGEYTPIRSR